MEWWMWVAAVVVVAGAVVKVLEAKGRAAPAAVKCKQLETERALEAARAARAALVAEVEERRREAKVAAQREAGRAFRAFVGDFPRFRDAADEGLDCEGVAIDYLAGLLGERLLHLLPAPAGVRVLGIDYVGSRPWHALRSKSASAPTPEALRHHRAVRGLVDQLAFPSPSGLPWPGTMTLSLSPVQYLRDPGEAAFVGAFLYVNADGLTLEYPATVLVLAYGTGGGTIAERYVPEIDGPCLLTDDAEGA